MAQGALKSMAGEENPKRLLGIWKQRFTTTLPMVGAAVLSRPPPKPEMAGGKDILVSGSGEIKASERALPSE